MGTFVLIPGAVAEPIDTQYLTNLPFVSDNRLNLHAAGNENDPYPYFNAYDRPSSTGWVEKTGLLHQYVSADLRAEADFEGNDASRSLETQNNGAEPLTQPQIETIARVFASLRASRGLANQIAVSSKLGQESKGLSWHRLGIDGNFPALPSIYAGRTQRGGGMLYSKSFGKVCPGNPYIDQIQTIFNLSQTIDFDPLPSSPVIVAPPTSPSAPPPVLVTYRILKEDGVWGTNTTLRLQDYFNTLEDGVISHQWKSSSTENILSMQFDKSGIGSDLIYAMQGALGFTGKSRDRLGGPQFVGSLEEHYRVTREKVPVISAPRSETVARMQAALNKNTF